MVPAFAVVSTLLLSPQLMKKDSVICDTREGSTIFYKNTHYAFISRIEDGFERFPIYKSKDLRNWRKAGIVFDYGDGNPMHSWANAIWSVGVEMMTNRTFQAYFIGREKTTNAYGIGQAFSSKITGPYKALREPLFILKPRKILFDPFVFNNNGYLTMYLRETQSLDAKIYALNLNVPEDSVKWKRAIKNNNEGVLKEIYSGSKDHTLVRDPFVLNRNGTYYMFYTALFQNLEATGIGVARGESLLGPFEVLVRPLILAPSSDNWLKLFSVISLKDGTENHIIFAAFNEAHDHMDMLVHNFAWGADEWPLMFKL